MAKNTELFRAICVNGRTNVEIAHAMGITSQSVCAYLHGRALVPIRRREAFERAVDTTVDWFYYEQIHKGEVKDLPPPAPPPAPAKTDKKGFWGNIFDDGDEELTNAV